MSTKRKKPDIEPGALVSPSDAHTILEDMLPQAPMEEEERISQLGNALYTYKFEDKINGIVVAEQDRKLMIDREKVLEVAFRLVQVERSWVFWMSPENTEEIKKYEELLNQANAGRVRIVEELKQYDVNKHAFMVWIRYYECEYALHPRFEYLRKELTNE